MKLFIFNILTFAMFLTGCKEAAYEMATESVNGYLNSKLTINSSHDYLTDNAKKNGYDSISDESKNLYTVENIRIIKTQAMDKSFSFTCRVVYDIRIIDKFKEHVDLASPSMDFDYLPFPDLPRFKDVTCVLKDEKKLVCEELYSLTEEDGGWLVDSN